MAIAQGYGSIATNGLIFAYDTGDTYNSYLGRPTTNVLANAGLSTYNNVSGNVSSNLYSTSETYRGATVWRQDLTALDGSGAYYLSNGNNPGIGVVTGGGGGSANTYTGHTIYFKPTVPMHSIPIYLAYSNIGGWQANTTPPENMGDGWFRAYVLWYDTVTRADGKYWAINPLSTSTGQTVTIYWAGPFREDLNSTTISQFVNGSRSTTQSVLDLSNNSIVDVTNASFITPAINPQITFDGTDDYISPGSFNLLGMVNSTLESVVYFNALSSPDNSYSIFGGISNEGYHGYHEVRNGGSGYKMTYWTSANGWQYANTALSSGRWYHLVWVWSGTYLTWYLNGISDGSYTFSTFSPYGLGINRISSFPNERYMNGRINVAKIYNRALSAGEIKQNYDHYKTRFGLT